MHVPVQIEIGIVGQTNKMSFSNADKSTNANMDRILNVLARYFDEDISKVLTQHLASRKVSIADATTLTHTPTC